MCLLDVVGCFVLRTVTRASKIDAALPVAICTLLSLIHLLLISDVIDAALSN